MKFKAGDLVHRDWPDGAFMEGIITWTTSLGFTIRLTKQKGFKYNDFTTVNPNMWRLAKKVIFEL
jgi:hypothetical protein